MKSVGVAVTAIALAISAPAFAAGQTIPLATMTCKQFVDSPKNTIGVILTWMMGYLQDEDEPAELDFSKMEDLGKKLGTYCGQNPTHGAVDLSQQPTLGTCRGEREPGRQALVATGICRTSRLLP
jgi:acid stress chaperone HdeB